MTDASIDTRVTLFKDVVTNKISLHTQTLIHYSDYLISVPAPHTPHHLHLIRHSHSLGLVVALLVSLGLVVVVARGHVRVAGDRRQAALHVFWLACQRWMRGTSQEGPSVCQ